MKHNLRILKLNLEIDRLRDHLEDSRKRNLKLEMKAKKLFQKIKTLNKIQMNSEIAKKWGKELNDLETIMEESEIFNDINSQREITQLFSNMSREIAQSLEAIEPELEAVPEKKEDTLETTRTSEQKEEVEIKGEARETRIEAQVEVTQTKAQIEEAQIKARVKETGEPEQGQLTPLIQKLNKIDFSLLNGKGAEERLKENPIDLTGWVIDSFEHKVRDLGRTLQESIDSKSRRPIKQETKRKSY